MNVKRRAGSGLLLLVLGFGAVAAGCGSDTTTKATPLGSVPGASTAPTTSVPGPTARPTSTPTTAASDSGSTPKPTPQQLSAATQDLNLAGTSLSGSDGAISGTDVDQAKNQEGSAP